MSTPEPTKRPSFQFYPNDWMTDSRLRDCCLAAQGLWISAMCVAHGCDPYGYLIVNGRAMNAAQLARRVGAALEECEKLLSELEEAGVFSRDGVGAIFSRRMVRDERIRNARAEGGRAGAEFGHLGKKYGHLGKEHGVKGGRPRHDGTPPRRATVPPAANVAHAIEPAPTRPDPAAVPPELDVVGFRQAWAEWKADRSARRIKPLTPKGEERQLKHLAGYGPAVAIEAIEIAMRNQWQGLFPEMVLPKRPGVASATPPKATSTFAGVAAGGLV